MEKKYDIAIIGSGLGGLYSAALLSKEGLSVCLLEKNKQIGGSLQTFSRDKIIFDTGVHYIGGLDKGQNLYRYFDYLGIMDYLKIRKMDEDGFDRLSFDGDPVTYNIPQGYDNFIEKLSGQFPKERAGIQEYCQRMQDICNKLPLYKVEPDEESPFLELVVGDRPVDEVINGLTTDKKLREVLAGNNALYAGVEGQTPFYVHALVCNSYIESSYKCLNGGSQISLILQQIIVKNGGKILKNADVKKIETNDKEVTHLSLANGEKIFADKYISGIHPAVTMDMIDPESKLIRNVYRKRISSLANSTSSFAVYISLKDEVLPEFNYNMYHIRYHSVWNNEKYTAEDWPRSVAIFTTPSLAKPQYCAGLILMSYMNDEDVAPWAETFNTTSYKSNRDTSYENFKIERAEKLIDLAAEKIPGIRSMIKNYYTSTPLSFRDYIGGKDGSMYGIVKDYRDPLKTFINTKTKIPNLYLTGQNLVMHGVLGVTIGAVKTCNEILGDGYLIRKIKEETL